MLYRMKQNYNIGNSDHKKREKIYNLYTVYHTITTTTAMPKLFLCLWLWKITVIILKCLYFVALDWVMSASLGDAREVRVTLMD